MTTAVPVFDQLRATVSPGDHAVARFPGLLLVVRRDSRGADDAVPDLLRICAEVTAEAPRSPGRTLARRLTGWLALHEQAPGFGTLAATDDGVAVFLYGDVTAWAEGLELGGSSAAFTVDRLVDWPDGPLMLAADGSPIVEDTGVDWLGLHRGVVVGGGAVLHPQSQPAFAPVAGDLPPAPLPPAGDPSGPAPATKLDLPAAPPPDPEVSGVIPPPAPAPVLSEKIFGVAPDEPPRAPLPVLQPVAAAEVLYAEPRPESPGDGRGHGHPGHGDPGHEHPGHGQPGHAHPGPEQQGPGRPGPGHEGSGPQGQGPWPPGPEAAPGPGAPGGPGGPGAPDGGQVPPAPPTGFVPSPPPAEGVVVLGYRCSRGHLNDPRVSFCATCGIRMDQLTGVLVRGRRPPLGIIVLDTGSTFILDDDYLLGRDPDSDGGVREGRLRPLRLEDNSGTMSRAHLEIRLRGWDVTVVDRGSANGTFIAGPGQQGWSAVVPGQPLALVAGTQVGIGRRTFTFESQHGRL